MDTKELRNRIEQLKGRRDHINHELDELTVTIRRTEQLLRQHEEALEVIRIVGQQTQEQLRFYISDIVTKAISAVYPDPYDFVVKFVKRRNKTECDLLFVRDGNEVDPLDASGGGVVNIASLALRIASWSMENPRSNNVIILDEPFHDVRSDQLPLASEMIKSISMELGLQIIMIVNATDLLDGADRTFLIQKQLGQSIVEQL